MINWLRLIVQESSIFIRQSVLEVGPGDRVLVGGVHDLNEAHLVIPTLPPHHSFFWGDGDGQYYYMSTLAGSLVNDKSIKAGIPIQLKQNDQIILEEGCKFIVMFWNTEVQALLPTFRIQVCGINKECGEQETPIKGEDELFQQPIRKIKKRKQSKRPIGKREGEVRLCSEYSEGVSRLMQQRESEIGSEVVEPESWLNERNVGFQMLKKMGWKEGSGLGKRESDIPTTHTLKGKQNKKGLGMDS